MNSALSTASPCDKPYPKFRIAGQHLHLTSTSNFPNELKEYAEYGKY